MSVSKDVLAAMARTNEIFDSEVVQQQKFDALDQIYTADAHVLPPGAAAIGGLAQIKAFWQGAVTGLGLKSAKLETVHAEMSGEGVVEIGRASLGLNSGQTVAIKYVVYWKQEQGRWKWAVDIWNQNE